MAPFTHSPLSLQCAARNNLFCCSRNVVCACVLHFVRSKRFRRLLEAFFTVHQSSNCSANWSRTAACGLVTERQCAKRHIHAEQPSGGAPAARTPTPAAAMSSKGLRVAGGVAKKAGKKAAGSTGGALIIPELRALSRCQSGTAATHHRHAAPHSHPAAAARPGRPPSVPSSPRPPHPAPHPQASSSTSPRASTFSRTPWWCSL
jgi:hypothetical protein